MSKLLKLKEWLTLEDAASYVANVSAQLSSALSYIKV